MFVVAITRLTTTPDADASLLARACGNTVYEARLLIAAGLPCVLLTTSDREQAGALLAAVRGAGFGAVACDTDAVKLRREMTRVAQFRFDPDAFVTQEGAAAESRLPYVDVLALLRGEHKSWKKTTKEVKEKQFAAGRALLSGGLAVRKSTTREVVETDEARDEVLYLFRRDGEDPWVLVDAEARYAGLGDRLGRTQRENFLATVECLRAMCPEARYDERLLSHNRVPERFVRTTSVKASEITSSDGVDLLAHVLALAIARGQT